MRAVRCRKTAQSHIICCDAYAKISRPVPVASRVNRFSYAIRNIVAEAKVVEARGMAVRYLNIGDPVAFGFQTPAHLIETVNRAMRDGHNGYLPSAGIPAAREAVAADYRARGVPDVGRSRRHHRRHVGRHRAGALRAGQPRRRGTGAVAHLSARTPRCSPRSARRRATTGRIRRATGCPISTTCAAIVTEKTKVIVDDRPEQPDRRGVSDGGARAALIEIAERHQLTILADEVYGDTGLRPVRCRCSATLDLDAPIISFSSLSKAYLAPGWRTGWLVVGSTPRLDDALAAIKKMADGRLCSPGPMQHAVDAGADSATVRTRPTFRRPRSPSAPRSTELPERHSRHVGAWRRAARSTRCRR